MNNKNYGLREEVLNSIINIGMNYDIEKIILFGSRARGDYKERSDIDIAVCGARVEEFEAELDEECPTLLKFDVINMGKPVQNELLASIKKEGIVIYEKI